MTSMIRTMLTATAAIGIAATALPAQARTTTGTMAVSATALESCTVAASPLVFGTTSQTGSAVDSTASVTVACTPNVSYSVGLNSGANASGAQRRMADAVSGDFLPYQIYRDAAHTQLWGNTVGTDTVSGTVTSAPVVHTAYGRIAATVPGVTAGAYTDTVTVTLTF